MLVLSIDTCGSLGSVALAHIDLNTPPLPGSIHLLGQTDLPGKTYSAQLIPAIRDLLRDSNAAVTNLDAIVVTTGPGSFTGIRIGLGSAKGLAEVQSTPILAVSRLAVLAHKAQARAAALDAGRGEFYFGDFGDPDGSATAAPESSDQPNPGEIAVETLLTRLQFEEAAARLVQSLAICERSAQAVAPSATLTDPPTAADSLRFALIRLRARDFNNPVTLDGHYLRRSDAEIFAKPKLSMIARP